MFIINKTNRMKINYCFLYSLCHSYCPFVIPVETGIYLSSIRSVPFGHNSLCPYKKSRGTACRVFLKFIFNILTQFKSIGEYNTNIPLFVITLLYKSIRSYLFHSIYDSFNILCCPCIASKIRGYFFTLFQNFRHSFFHPVCSFSLS